MKLYAADAVLFAPGEMPRKGFSAIHDEWKEAFEESVFEEVRLSDIAGRTSGNLSASWGTFTLTLRSRSGAKRTTTSKGRFTSIAEKRDGKWLYIAVTIGDFREEPLPRPSPTGKSP